MLIIGASHQQRLATAFEKLNQQDCMAKGAFSCGVAIFVWVLLNSDVLVVIEMGAYIHGVFFSMGAFSPDFTVCSLLWCACKINLEKF